MELSNIILNIFFLLSARASIVDIDKTQGKNATVLEATKSNNSHLANRIEVNLESDDGKLNEVFIGVYTDCLLKLSYSCLQKKTLVYLNELNNMSEVSVFGDYVKFVKFNTTERENFNDFGDHTEADSNELGFMIDQAVDKFFNSHIIKFSALGRDITMPRNVDEFVGRKKRKGGGGGGGHGDDDGGKKKMMMMAMMCMKMKLMMMVPAMMGMMGMMSFKGMMFSMMSFMMTKMMLLMKLLEKKGATGFGAGGGAGDGGWAAASGGGGAWMPAGGQDFAGGGYDANAQWQSRSILEKLEKKAKEPIITYVMPAVSYNRENKLTIDEVRRTNDYIKPKRSKRSLFDVFGKLKTNNDPKTRILNDTKSQSTVNELETQKAYYIKTNAYESMTEMPRHFSIINQSNKLKFMALADKSNNDVSLKSPAIHPNLETTSSKKVGRDKAKSRSKRSILDIIQNTYIYWMNKLIGLGNNRRNNVNPKFKIVNGIKYIYYPIRPIQRIKTLKEIHTSDRVKTVDDGFKPIITVEDFNKGEILQGAESRMNKKKFHKMKNSVNDTMDDNPWE